MMAVEPYPMPSGGDPTPEMGLVYTIWLIAMWWHYIGVPVHGLKYPYPRRIESRQVKRARERAERKQP
jgi:hypothetical protein